MTVDRPADLVFVGGRLATMDPARSWAIALAVRDGRIVEVGDDAAVKPHIGPRSRVIELAGRTMTPGFGDAHVHPIHGGLARMRCELHGSRGQETYLRLVAAYAAGHPDEGWIRGGGWTMDDFPRGVPGRAATGSSRTGRSSCRVATGIAPGSTAARSSWPA